MHSNSVILPRFQISRYISSMDQDGKQLAGCSRHHCLRLSRKFNTSKFFGFIYTPSHMDTRDYFSNDADHDQKKG